MVPKPITTNELFELINEICPLGIQEEWDNCGAQIDMNKCVTTVLTCLEINNKVIDEAVDLGAQVIVSHHPLFMKFQQLTKLTFNRVPDMYAIRLIEHGISVYSAHTNFDAMTMGNNDELGRILGFDNIAPMGDDGGICRMTLLNESKKASDVCREVARALNLNEKTLAFVGDFNKEVKKIGWCTGSGSGFLDEARASNIDLFITGDVKYHDGQNALEIGPMILDIGHYGSEKIFGKNMAGLLERQLKIQGIDNVEVKYSTVDLDPFKFLV